MSNQVFSFGFNGIKNYELPTFSGFRSVSEAEAAINRLVVHDFNSSNEIIYFSFGSGNTHLYLHGQFKPADLPTPSTVGEVTSRISGEVHSAVFTDLDSSYKGTTVYQFDNPITLNPSDIGEYDVIRQAHVYQGNDTFWASKDADTIFGFGGDDTFYASFDRLASRPNEDDIIFGGGGEDRVVLSGAMHEYNISRGTLDLGNYLPSGSIESTTIISRSDNPSETTTIHSVELIEFEDLSVSYTAPAQELFRLYQAAFDRTPDEVGLGYWITQLKRGVSTDEIAAAFLNSDEFETTFGSDLDDIGYVYALYENVLQRAPDSQGLSYWLNELNTNNEMDRAGMLLSFSESAENIANTNPLIELGIVYQPYGDALVG